ncbi:MAG: CBS domain-containing protein [Bacteroidota bacterium]
MKPIGGVVKGRTLYSISKSSTVSTVAQYMAEKNIGAVPVVEENRLVGVFSERDVITRIIAKGLNPATTRIEDVMTVKIVVADVNEAFTSALKKMQVAHCRHLPVVDGEQLVGFVSLRDLLMMDLDEKEQDLDYLHSYIYTVPSGAAKRYEGDSKELH